MLEIAALPDHILDECDHKSEYVACDVTGKTEIKLRYIVYCIRTYSTVAHFSDFYWSE